VTSALKRAAVRHVKPRVSQGSWDRLRGRKDEPPRPDLTEIARRTSTDKWGVHFYTPHYERHLSHLRDSSFVLLEIGVGGYARDRQGGASLRMWKRYFQQAQIVGLDLEDKSFIDRPRTRPSGPIRPMRPRYAQWWSGSVHRW